VSLRLLAPWICCAAIAVVAVVALSEARRTSGRNARLEAELGAAASARQASDSEEQALRADLDTANAGLADLRARLAQRDARIVVLQDEAFAAIARAEAIGAAIEQQRAELEAARNALEDRRARGRAPMPEGVRLAVEALEDTLRRDGFGNLRVVDAESVEDHELRDVEVVDRSADGRDVTYYRAGVMTVELERDLGDLVLRFRDGHSVRNGFVEDLPEDGQIIRFAGVDGPRFEQRLPYLVQPIGAYPDDGAHGAPQVVMDPLTRERWAGRLRQVFELARTELRYEVGRFRTIENGRFRDAALHALDARKLLAQSIEAASIAIEVDRAIGTVSLLLEDGVLRKAGGETTIPKSGYRILLPGVTPAQAIDAMLGFVVFRQ